MGGELQQSEEFLKKSVGKESNQSTLASTPDTKMVPRLKNDKL